MVRHLSAEPQLPVSRYIVEIYLIPVLIVFSFFLLRVEMPHAKQ